MHYGHFSLSSLPNGNVVKEIPKVITEPQPQPQNQQNQPIFQNQYPMSYIPQSYMGCTRCRCSKCKDAWKKLKEISVNEKRITIDPSLSGGVIEEQNNGKKEVIFKTRDGKEVKFLTKK